MSPSLLLLSLLLLLLLLMLLMLPLNDLRARLICGHATALWFGPAHRLQRDRRRAPKFRALCSSRVSDFLASCSRRCRNR